MADDDYNEPDMYEDEPEPEIEEGAEEDVENNENEDMPVDRIDTEDKDEVPVERPRKTSKFMTKYERARILGTRALQIRNSLLMGQPRLNNENHSLIIDIPDGGNASTSRSSSESDLTQHGNAAVHNDQPSSGVQSSLSSSNRSNSRPGPSFYKVLVSVKLTFKMSLIFSSMIVLIMSRHEKPRNPLFAWIVGYTVGCAVSIPIIFRHYFISRPRLFRTFSHMGTYLQRDMRSLTLGRSFSTKKRSGFMFSVSVAACACYSKV